MGEAGLGSGGGGGGWGRAGGVRGFALAPSLTVTHSMPPISAMAPAPAATAESA